MSLLYNFQDPDWRVKNLYTIVDKDGEQIPFYPNEIQQLVNKNPASRKMILKARQFGVSTSEIIKMFDATIFTPNRTHCILAHEQDSIKKLFRIVQRAYKFLPDEIRPRLDRGGGSKYEMFFPDINSRIYCDLESRGDTIHWLHVSEAAFMKDSAKLKSTLQAVPMETGRVTIETTANGMANYFFDMWNDPDQPYSKMFFPWYVFSKYKLPVNGKLELTREEKQFVVKAKKLFGVSITYQQIAFRRFKQAELKTNSNDVKRVSFIQEYPEDDKTCFLASGEGVMDPFKIQAMIDTATPPLEDDEGLKVYERVNKKRVYVIGADPAEGIKKDFSVGVVMDAKARKVVAKIRGQWKPSLFAQKLAALGKLYSSPGPVYPKIAVERNNHGHAVLLELNEHEHYPNIYVSPKDERLGWQTDSISRPIMMNSLIDSIEEGYLKCDDLDILAECLTLVDNSGKIEAIQGKHDDCITACAITHQLALKESVSTNHDDLESRIGL